MLWKNMNWRKNQCYNNSSRKRKNDKKRHTHEAIKQWKDDGGFHQKESPRKKEKSAPIQRHRRVVWHGLFDQSREQCVRSETGRTTKPGQMNQVRCLRGQHSEPITR